MTQRPDMPLFPGGPRLGPGLWNSVPWTLAVELAMFATGTWIYVGITRAKDAVGRWGLLHPCVLLASGLPREPWQRPAIGDNPVYGLDGRRAGDRSVGVVGGSSSGSRFTPRLTIAPAVHPQAAAASGRAAPEKTAHSTGAEACSGSRETGVCRWPVRAASLCVRCFPDVRPTRYGTPAMRVKRRAPSSCGDTCRRKNRYLRISDARARAPAFRGGFESWVGTITRDNLGDNGPARKSKAVVYLGSRRGEVAEWPKAAVC